MPKHPSSMVGQRSLAATSNLANLLPTGTVLAAQALIPSFTNNGECTPANRYLTIALTLCCSIACFLSSFTDSFIGKDGKLYYGIATFKGLHVFNDIDGSDEAGQEELKNFKKDFKINVIDFVHAFASLIVFLVFSLSSSDVQDCFFPKEGPNEKQLIMNLPLGAGILASFLFMIFPTKRRGIGYGDTTPLSDKNPFKEKESTSPAVSDSDHKTDRPHTIENTSLAVPDQKPDKAHTMV